MAHIPDGVLTAPVLIAGALASAGLVAVALRRLDYDRLPQAAVLAAGFFVSSLIQVPFGVTSVHLLLNGLMGLLLGWTAVPALLVALTLQTVFFGYGGALVLGVNTFNLALPALICALLLSPWLAKAAGRQVFWIGALAGLLGVLLSGDLGGIVAGGEWRGLPARGLGDPVRLRPPRAGGGADHRDCGCLFAACGARALGCRGGDP